MAPIIGRLLQRLSKVQLPNLPVGAEENRVFFVRAYLTSHINNRFQNALLIPLEIKKVFMDELKGEIYPLVLQFLAQQLKGCMAAEVSAFFARRYTSKRRVKASDILTEKNGFGDSQS